MYNVNGQYGQQAQVPANRDGLHTASVLLGVGMVIWAVVQVVFFFQSRNQLTSGMKVFGTAVVLLNVLMWMALLIGVATKKDNALLGKLCAIGVFMGLLTFIYDMKLIGWIMNLKILLSYSNSLLLFLSMTIVLLMKNRATAHNMWFVPGIICSLIYLLSIQAIFNYGFRGLRPFLSYVLFPACTIAFSFVFMMWAVKRDQIPVTAPANYGQFNPAPGYMPYPVQPQPQGYSSVQPSPMQSAPIPADTKPCPKCGNIISINDRFCAQCGASNMPKFCSGCGAPLNEGDKFCSKCGKPVV